jgi:hypothetical protein
MKFAALSILAPVAIAIGLLALPTGTAFAQDGACQTNPSPVDSADPAIIVDTPSAGDSVTSPITVSGQALVFEAVVSLALYDADGSEISTATAMAADGTQLSDFSGTIDFSVTEDTPACLWVFESSAQDGSPRNVVQIELTLQPAASSPAPTLPDTGGVPSARDDPSSNVVWFIVGTAVVALVLAGAGALTHRRR